MNDRKSSLYSYNEVQDSLGNVVERNAENVIKVNFKMKLDKLPVMYVLQVNIVIHQEQVQHMIVVVVAIMQI